MKEVSERSKKNEILDAYHELLKKVQKTKEESHQDVQRKQHEDEIVVKAAKFDVEHIVSSLGQIKVMVTQSLGMLEKKLVEEHTKLNEVQTAIKVENKNLEEVHQIKKNADSLAALLLAQKEREESFKEEMSQRKNDFEQEMDATRHEWELEKKRADKAQAEYAAEIKMKRLRQEEEYQYTFAHKRKKESDVYEAKKSELERDLEEKKSEFEKECAQRKAVLDEAEKEMEELRNRVALFPKELKQAADSAEKNTREALEREYRYKIDLKATEIEGKNKLQQQTIASLQAKIKEQETLIRDLSQKAEIAGKQVQSIALKALEGVTGINRNERDDYKKMQHTAKNEGSK